MSFDSLTYLIFLPAVCLLHWAVPQRLRWLVLLAASYVFYACWDASLSLLILGVTAAAYIAGRLVDRSCSKAARMACLLLAMLPAIGVLIYFKYINLLGRSAAALLGLLGRKSRWEPLAVMLPVGVSFYTFQAISYVIDVYRGRMRPERHFGYFALYIAFFPQLVAGPIERADALLPQLRAERRFTAADGRAAAALLLSGYFRKLVAADLAASFVEAVYQAQAPDGSAVLMGTLLFALQIYGDFSGYSEIAAGSAQLLGIRLMRNFRQPYRAENIRDFWRRWHVSLTKWFTDYIYIPLGGSRRGLKRQLLATMAVFLLCGLWHGAEWNYAVWGMLHGLFLNGYTLLRRIRAGTGRQAGEQGRLSRELGRAATLGMVCFAWIFFRANDLPHALRLVGSLFSPWHWEEGLALMMAAAVRSVTPAALAVLLTCILLVLEKLPQMVSEEAGIQDAAWVCLLLSILTAVFIRMDSGTVNAFIYFQF